MVYTKIIIEELFNSDVDETVIDQVYEIIGRGLMQYDNNDYVDTSKMDICKIDENCLSLVLISHALCGENIIYRS